MKKNKLLEFIILLITMNYLINSIITKNNPAPADSQFLNENLKLNDTENKRFRKLQNNSTAINGSEVYRDICISKNYSYELMEYIDPFSKTLSEVLNFTFIKNTDSSTSIVKFIKDPDAKFILEYVIANIIFFIILIFAAVSLISFFFNCICCCFPATCCRMREKPEDEKPMCRTLVLLLLVIFSVLSIVCCVLSLTFLAEFLVGIDSISCSVNKFVYQIKNGQSGNEIPRWMGINNIMLSYKAAINLIPEMSKNYKSTFQDNKNKSDYYLNQINNFILKLDSVDGKYKNKSFENVNPRKSQILGDNSLRPSFVSNLGNYTDPSSMLGQIVTTIENTYFKAIDSFRSIQDNANKFIEYSDSIREMMLEILRRLQQFDDITDKIQKNFTNIWFDTRENFNEEGHTTSLNSLIGIISFLVLNIVILVFYVGCKIQCCRYISHLFWMILTFITLATFSASFGFGILSSLAYDAKTVMGFILSDDNLFNEKYLIKNKEAADILNVCLNYGGDLGSELYDMRNSDMNYLDKIYQFSYKILEKDFSLSSVSDSIGQQAKSLQGLIDDIRLVTVKGSDATVLPKQLLEELQKWSDYYVPNSYQNKFNCKTITRDAWATQNFTCPVGYPLKTSSNGKENLGAANCFIIGTWADAYVNIRYSENPWDCDNGDPNKRKTNEVKDPDFASVKDAIYTYWVTIRRYTEWHNTVVNNLIGDYLKLIDAAKEIEAKIQNQLYLIKVYTRPLFNLFIAYVGKTNTYEILNCGFLVGDFQYIMKSLEIKVASSSLKLCIVVFCMSLLNFTIVILSLLAILRFRIIIKRKIIRNRQGYIEELDQMSLKESEHREQQEIEMRILNSQQRRNEPNNGNLHDNNQYENVNKNPNENDNSQIQSNLNEVVAKRRYADY